MGRGATRRFDQDEFDRAGGRIGRLAVRATTIGCSYSAWIRRLGDALRFFRRLLDHEEGLMVFDDPLDVVELMSAQHDEVIREARVCS